MYRYVHSRTCDVIVGMTYAHYPLADQALLGWELDATWTRQLLLWPLAANPQANHMQFLAHVDGTTCGRSNNSANLENKVTSSERSCAHCSMYRDVHPRTFDSNLRMSYPHYPLADEALNRWCIHGCMITLMCTPAHARVHRFAIAGHDMHAPGLKNAPYVLIA